MENRYPFLALWKKIGLTKFPTIPPEKLLQILAEPHLKKAREEFKKSYYSSPTVVALSPEDAKLEEEMTFQKELKPAVEEAVWKRFLDLLEEQDKKVIDKWLEARRK